jgi:predicted cupin superfamily sugar epimerase
MMTASDLIHHLGLRPLPLEGGHFREMWRSEVSLDSELPPGDYHGSRSAGTAIYYLLTPDTFSALHQLPGDEVYHFYMGDPVELLLLYPGGESDVVTLGQELASGMALQQVVPGGCWQGSRLRAGGRFALMGTTMAPGFDARDLRMGNREELVTAYRSREALIRTLCREA